MIKVKVDVDHMLFPASFWNEARNSFIKECWITYSFKGNQLYIATIIEKIDSGKCLKKIMSFESFLDKIYEHRVLFEKTKPSFQKDDLKEMRTTASTLEKYLKKYNEAIANSEAI